jgi:ADP-ribose pyrophosphatase YjhB (NUDIX family)
VHYVNPRLVAAVLPERDGRVLLLRRAIEPSYGLWTFPGGYLELGESAEAGAEREAMEEVGLEVRAGAVLGVYTLTAQGTVLVVYRGTTASGDPARGPETLDTAWFEPHQIPWPNLAFETTAAALSDWLSLLQAPGQPYKPGS